MKRCSLLFVGSTLLFFASCANTNTVKDNNQEVETVAPELGPVQQIAAQVDSIADTATVLAEKGAMDVKSAITKTVDTGKKTVKQAAIEMKAELKKTTQTIKSEANKVVDATKSAASKAAGQVEKTSKEVKESLKK